MCDRLKCLPRTGGMLDQPAAIMPRLFVVWTELDQEVERQSKKANQSKE